MLSYILRLYLRYGAKRTAKRLSNEIGVVYDKTDMPRYTGVAIDDFFCRVERFLRRHTSFDATKTLEEEREMAKRKYASW